MQSSTIEGRESETTAAHVLALPGGLRVSEKLVLGFFAYAAIICLMFHLSLRERLTIIGLNVIACTVVFLLKKETRERPTQLLTSLRDWLPAVLILLAYRESGLFFRPDPIHRLDHLFVRWDSVLLQNPFVLHTLSFLSPWLQYYLEVSYLFCYPLVPLGLGCLLLAQRRRGHPQYEEEHPAGWAATVTRNFSPADRVPNPEARLPSPEPQVIDRFWTTVLLALFCCYVLYPFFPLTPPRLLFHDLPGPAPPPFLRKANFWILAHYGVQASVFPSGHVAAVVATALVIRAYLLRLGFLFLIAAASIAVATVCLRYHYAADALTGALVGWVAFCISSRIHR